MPGDEEEKEVCQRQKAAFKKLCQDHDLVLVPVYDSAGGAGAEHWTLLSVLKVAQGQVQVRYYDTLIEESGSSRACAGDILILMATFLEGCRPDVPRRRNHARQGIVECGFFVCWYIEEEVRHFMEEAWGA